MIQIHAFLFDDENDEKFAVHGIRGEQVAQILEDEFRVSQIGRHGGLPTS